MKRELYIGVDPGKAGFITTFADGIFNFYPMPTHKVDTGELTKTGKKKLKSTFHEEGLMSLAVEIHNRFKGYKVYGCIEKVTGRQGWSATNNFNFGYVAGMQKMILIMLNAEIMMVRPQKWQSAMYEGFDKIMKPSSTGKTMVHDTKATSALVAQKIAPQIIFSKQGVKKKDGSIHGIDDNKTDSFLMCLYLFRKKNQRKDQ